MMSQYKVIVVGNECIVMHEGEAIKVGFFTTRLVRAANHLEAEARALKVVTDELKGLLTANSPMPGLSAVEITKISSLQGLWSKPKGFTFYPAEETDDVFHSL